jgi:hypothetical protein
MLEQIATRGEVATITARLLAASPDPIQTRVEEVRLLVEEEISNLRNMLYEKAPLAKTELHRHVDEVRMSPSGDGKGWHFVAEADWDLLGTDSGVVTGRPSVNWRPVMVAGVRFELTTFGLCDLTQLSLRVGLYLHPGERDARHPVSTPSSFFRGLVRYCRTRTAGLGSTDFDE